MIVDGSYDKFKYILYTPPNATSPPIVVVLHGSGKIGSSLSKMKQREPYLALSKAPVRSMPWYSCPNCRKAHWSTIKPA